MTVTNLEFEQAQWTELAFALDAMIAGTITLTEGCRRVFELRHSLEQDSNELFDPFSDFYSESDAFPLGEVRKLWAAHALVEMDIKREAIEQLHKDWIIDAAKTLRRSVANR
jgi:hypothetical protein